MTKSKEFVEKDGWGKTSKQVSEDVKMTSQQDYLNWEKETVGKKWI